MEGLGKLPGAVLLRSNRIPCYQYLCELKKNEHLVFVLNSLVWVLKIIEPLAISTTWPAQFGNPRVVFVNPSALNPPVPPKFQIIFKNASHQNCP